MNIYEAIREVRAGREAWATLDGARLRLAPVPVEGLDRDCSVLARWRIRGGVTVAHASPKDASPRVRLTAHGRTRRTSMDDVFAVVIEAHSAPKRGASMRL